MPGRSLLLILSLLSAACGTTPDPRRDPLQPAPAPTLTAKASAGVPAAPPSRVLVDLVQTFPACDVDHRGPLLDTGTVAMVGRFGWSRGITSGVASVEHDGSTWARVTDRRLQVSFSL